MKSPKILNLATVDKENLFTGKITLGTIVLLGLPANLAYGQEPTPCWAEVICPGDGITYIAKLYNHQPLHTEYAYNDHVAFGRENVLNEWNCHLSGTKPQVVA